MNWLILCNTMLSKAVSSTAYLRFHCFTNSYRTMKLSSESNGSVLPGMKLWRIEELYLPSNLRLGTSSPVPSILTLESSPRSFFISGMGNYVLYVFTLDSFSKRRGSYVWISVNSIFRQRFRKRNNTQIFFEIHTHAYQMLSVTHLTTIKTANSGLVCA